MPRTKRDPNMATVTYNAQNVERAIGYVTALINANRIYLDAVDDAFEYYGLSLIESAMVQMGTITLVAPQYRSKAANTEHQKAIKQPVVELLDVGLTENALEVVTDATTNKDTPLVHYTLEEMEDRKGEVRQKLIASKQKRAAAKQ